MTQAEAATRIGVRPATLRRWVSRGLIPQYDGEWTPAAIGTARVVARPVVELAGPHLEFERIAGVTLKGFREATEVFIARQKEEQ